MPDPIYLPLSHYHDRYRKAFWDLQQVNLARGKLEEQKAILKEQIAFVKEQQKLVANEFETAEIALRSAIVTQDEDGRPEAFRASRGEVGASGPTDVSSLKQYINDSKPGDKAKFVLVDGKLVEVVEQAPVAADGPKTGEDEPKEPA